MVCVLEQVQPDSKPAEAQEALRFNKERKAVASITTYISWHFTCIVLQ